MRTVTIEEAQAKLRELIQQMATGEELIITENQQAVAKMVRQPSPKPRLRPGLGLGKGKGEGKGMISVVAEVDERKSWPCQPGSAKDQIPWIASDFDAPLDDFKECLE